MSQINEDFLTSTIAPAADSSSLYQVSVTKDEAVLFDPNTLKIFIEKYNPDDKFLSFCSSDEAFEARFSNPKETAQIKKEVIYIPKYRPSLSRLTLHISNTCNLACKYCYASGGNYGIGKRHMRSNQALDLLGKAFSIFEIDCLMFFGGEPSLNVDVITDCCIFTNELYKQGLISKLPQFAVISNFAGSGQWFDKFLAVCKKFDIATTVSVDGPREIHDENRPTVRGGGSYDAVRANYLHAKQAGIKVGIECTYSNKHINHGITVVDLMKFFYSEFGERATHIAPASYPLFSLEKFNVKNLIDVFCDAVQFMILKYNTPEFLSFSIGERLISAIIERKAVSSYCPAGDSELTIGPDGQLFPCFMFVGQSAFQMGEIGENCLLSSQGKEVLKEIRRHGKKEHVKCQQCWARNVCSGCVGGDYLETGSLAAKPQCAMIMALLAEAIVRLAEKAQGLPSDKYGNHHRYLYLKETSGVII